MNPDDIFIRNTSSLFQYEKMAREVDKCDDIKTLQEMCKFFDKDGDENQGNLQYNSPRYYARD